MATIPPINSSPHDGPLEPLSTLPRPNTSPSNAPRLGLPFDQRLLLTTSLSFMVGFSLGSIDAGHRASLRFRAENAHRLPVSQPGWYLYHKSKNYYKWKYGVVNGMRRGAHLAAWTSVFYIVEESLDVFRGTWRAGRTMTEMEGVDELDLKRIDRGMDRSRDFWSSAMAGMVTGGLWSVWHQFPMTTAARTIRIGLMVGLGFGLIQDGAAWARKKYGFEHQSGQSWIHRGARNREVEEDVRRSLEREREREG